MLFCFLGGVEARLELFIDADLFLGKVALLLEDLFLLGGDLGLLLVEGSPGGGELFFAGGEVGEGLARRLFTRRKFAFARFELGDPIRVLLAEAFPFVKHNALRFGEFAALLFELLEGASDLHILFEAAGFLLGEGFFLGLEFGLSDRELVELAFGGGTLLLDAAEGFAGSVHLGLKLIALAKQALHFIQAGFRGGDGGRNFRFLVFEILRGALRGAHLFFPSRALGLQFLKLATGAGKFFFLSPEGLGAFGQLAVEILEVLPFLGEVVALFADLFLFEGERLLAFEELNAVAPHDFHLLRELMLPGGHLLKLHFKFVSGIEDGILRGRGGGGAVVAVHVCQRDKVAGRPGILAGGGVDVCHNCRLSVSCAAGLPPAQHNTTTLFCPESLPKTNPYRGNANGRAGVPRD